MIENDAYGEIIKLIYEETLFLRHFTGEIVDINDELKKGRVKVILPDIGMDTADKGLWCNPRMASSLIIPEVGQYAEVWFVKKGDQQIPVYLYPAAEIQNNTPKNYTGNTKEKILFEDAKSKSNNIKYDQDSKEITVFDGEDYAVKFNELKTIVEELQNDLTTLKSAFSGWVTVPNDGGAALKAATATWYGTAISGNMDNSKVEKVRLP